MATTVERFVVKTSKLIELERASEIEQTRVLTGTFSTKELQRRGVCLLKLHIASRHTGMYGKMVLVLETHLDCLPSHSFSSGDIVGLSLSSADRSLDPLASGIVSKVQKTSVSIAFDDSQDLFSLDDGPTVFYKINKLANDVTYRRLKRALTQLNQTTHRSSEHLISILFGQSELSPPLQVPDIKFINSQLDDSQQEAVKFSLSQKEVAVVHGPPGTGKTTTVIEIIHQTINMKNKILACAPSNIAVDNLVERLAGSHVKMIRLGHPARVLPHIQKYSLDAILAAGDQVQLLADVRKDLDKTLESIRKSRDKGEKQRLRNDMKHLRKEYRTREEAATRSVLQQADIILATLTSATNDGPLKLLDDNHFDVVIIDEVSQSLEAACWIPLQQARKCILAGDHLQLPPTIMSQEAAKEGLEVTLMERVLDLYGDSVMKMLTMQYRMHEKIMQWSSDKLYNSKLVAHTSVKDHLLKDLTSVEDTDITSIPVLYIDTAGCDLPELDLPDEVSKGNEGEADIVAAHVAKLVDSGMTQEAIAVIAPYNLQVEFIRLRLAEKYPRVEVKSVDGFQGREKEAVVISLVRSNAKGEVGFLSEKRRINVAVTRARRHLTIIGDSTTVSKDAFLQSLIEYLQAEGEVWSAHEYLQGESVYRCEVSRPEYLNDMIGQVTNTGKVQGQKKRQKKKKQEKVQDQQPPSAAAAAAPKREEVKNAEVDQRVCELEGEVTSFLKNKTVDILEFPPSLTGRERFLVHELAEKHGLGHCSKGDGEERHIVVTKPSAHSQQKTSVPPVISASRQDRSTVTAVEDSKHSQVDSKGQSVDSNSVGKPDRKNEGGQNKHVNEKVASSVEPAVRPKESNMTTCKMCNKDVIKANIQLHEIHCQRQVQGAKSADSKGKNKQKNASLSSQNRQFDKELEKRMQKVDDLDDMIATVTEMDKFCCFKKCKTKVLTVCSVCCHCDGRYCMSHQMPEVHGCGDAARAQARAQINRDGVLYRGSGVPNRKPDADRKALLQKRIDKKLNEKSTDRRRKQKNNK